MWQDDNQIEGKNAVQEALRSGKPLEKIYMLPPSGEDGTLARLAQQAQRRGIPVKEVTKERLDRLSKSHVHQGVIAHAAAAEYTSVEEILRRAREKGEDPFLILLDEIEDPHNLGAVIRTANLAGAHGVIIPKNHSAGLTGTVAKTSAGAVFYTPVARVTNMARTIEDLKKEGIWFVCADMNGTLVYELDLKGPIGLVIGNEGKGVSRLVREKCDFTASLPMKGNIDSLNASVAAGVLAYEVVRQRLNRS